MSKNIEPKNSKGLWHGYVETYHANGKLRWKGVYFTRNMYGYHANYWEDGKILDRSGYFLGGTWDHKVSDDNKEGYCYIWDREALDE